MRGLPIRKWFWPLTWDERMAGKKELVHGIKNGGWVTFCGRLAGETGYDAERPIDCEICKRGAEQSER